MLCQDGKDFSALFEKDF